MQFKTRGIVLNFIKYKESSIIVSIYTEQLGTQRYVVNSVRTKKPRTNIALFQPLTLVSMVVYYHPKRELHRISEIKCHFPFKSIPFKRKQTAIALFLSELLSKTLKEDHQNQPLFEFLYHSIMTLDKFESEPDNFHLQFMLKLTRFLGFEPDTPQLLFQELSLQGRTTPSSDSEMELIFQLKSRHYTDPIEPISNPLRRKILGVLLDFYSLHIEAIGHIHSPSILMEVLK